MKFINAILCVLILMCFFKEGNAQSESSVTEVYPLIVQFRADRGSLERFYFVQNSPERRERLTVFYKDYLSKLEQLPFETMSVSGRADYLLMKRDLENELGLLNTEEKEVKQVERYLTIGSPIYVLEKKTQTGLASRKQRSGKAVGRD